MPNAYHIKDWERDRENADTRKYVELLWFRNKVKLLGEGLGHTLVQEGKQGPFLYGMFKIIEQIAAGGKLGERGWLVRNGSPMDAARMGNLMRLPPEFFEEALKFFTTAPMDWLEYVEYSGESPAHPARTGRLSGESPAHPATHEDTRENTGRNAPSEERRTYKNIRTGEREKNGDSSTPEQLRAQQTQQFAAASARRAELQALPEDERTERQTGELKKMARIVRAVQKKQARGDFTPVVVSEEEQPA